MIKDIAEYLDIIENKKALTDIFDLVKHDKDYNTFGKTSWVSYSLEDNQKGLDTKYEQIYSPILSEHKKVHRHMQKRSTGFNTASSIGNDLFAHTDVDYEHQHPNCYNIIVPLFGNATIEYFETRQEEIYLPEKNAHGYAYYHEFLNKDQPGYEDFLQERKIGEIKVVSPVLLDTRYMHRVLITQAPRCAWCTRWVNVPADVTYRKFKNRIEATLRNAI